MYNYEIKTSFVGSEKQKAQTNKTGFNIKIVYFNNPRKLDIIRYDTCFFSVAFFPKQEDYFFKPNFDVEHALP